MDRETDPGIDLAVAYQDVTLAELRGLFDQLDFDLRDVLERELDVSRELDEIGLALDALRAKLPATETRAGSDATPQSGSDVPQPDAAPGPPGYDVPVVPDLDDFGLITTLAEARLAQLGVDLHRDPLPQVLPSSQIAQSLEHYAETYGVTSWDDADRAVVLAAGLVGTILDFSLVGTPRRSPITRWLKGSDLAKEVRKIILEPLEDEIHVPYDATHSKDTKGKVPLSGPQGHRQESPGHDPLLGFIIGVADIKYGRGTYFSEGERVTLENVADPVDLGTAVLTELLHLLSDVATPMGLPPPLFTLLSLVDYRSPFAVEAGGEKVTWSYLSGWMYRRGYDLRHFLASGVVPGAVTAVIAGYCLLVRFACGRKTDPAKLTSMLLMAHTIALSGTLLKVGTVGRMNPLTFNWHQLLAMGPVTLAWVAESAAREAKIRRGLDEEWQRLMVESERLLRKVEDQPAG